MSWQLITLLASNIWSFATASWLHCSHFKFLNFSFLLIHWTFSSVRKYTQFTLWQGNICFTGAQGSRELLPSYCCCSSQQSWSPMADRMKSATWSKRVGFGFRWEHSLKTLPSCCIFKETATSSIPFPARATALTSLGFIPFFKSLCLLHSYKQCELRPSLCNFWNFYSTIFAIRSNLSSLSPLSAATHQVLDGAPWAVLSEGHLSVKLANSENSEQQLK